MEKRPCLPLRYVCNIVVIPLQEDNRPSQPTASSFSSCTLQGVRRVCAASDGGQHGFQSTHSLRSATIGSAPKEREPGVSIHALLAECDKFNLWTSFFTSCFNPRTPCGVRPPPGNRGRPPTRFQSTHSLRSATGHVFKERVGISVSIHALLAECDFNLSLTINELTRFQSTHSLRSATG